MRNRLLDLRRSWDFALDSLFQVTIAVQVSAYSVGILYLADDATLTSDTDLGGIA
jgi:hypothetical protein